MLAELLTYMLTPCPRHLRAMGYLRGLIAIKARHRRCAEAWAEHLAHSRALILRAADKCPSHDKVVVLGSGLLLDIPLADLSRMFAEVELVDIFHMPMVRRAAARFANVRIEAIDVTGVVENVYQAAISGDGLPTPRSGNLPTDGADLVVSANLLTQLPYLPLKYLEERKTGSSKIEREELARALIRAHLADLEAAEGIFCLIAEMERLVTDGAEIIDREDALHGVSLPFKGDEWAWEVAPPPEVNRRYGLRYRVMGIISQQR